MYIYKLDCIEQLETVVIRNYNVKDISTSALMVQSHNDQGLVYW